MGDICDILLIIIKNISKSGTPTESTAIYYSSSRIVLTPKTKYTTWQTQTTANMTLTTEHFEYHRFVKAVKIACRLVKYSEHLVTCRHAVHCNVKKVARSSHRYEKNQPRASNSQYSLYSYLGKYRVNSAPLSTSPYASILPP